MRHRFPSIPTLPLFLACIAVVTLARPVAAQHCWPSNLALLVRDEAGALIHPQELDTFSYTPEDPDSADMGFRVRRLTADRWGPLAPEGTHALYWWGRGDCRVQVDEVVLTRGGREMRLRLEVRLDTEARPGPTEYVVDTPPFAEGTWELTGPLPPGELHRAVPVPADRWRRITDGGE